MRAIIKKKAMVANLTCYTELDLSGQSVDFVPGQVLHITLRPNDDKHKDELTHHFTITNSPNQKGVLSFTTRLRLKESLFKRTLNEAQIGDEVEVFDIRGSFTLPDNTGKPIVFIALGIGITPYISMLRWSFEEGMPYKFTLIYSDNEPESMAYLDEVKQMEKDHDNFKLIMTITHQGGWQGEKRHVDEQFIKDYLKDIQDYLYYISGPPNAVEAVAASLKDAGIAEESIKTDDFTGY